ncbi:MAG: glycosyltransferase, partial [Clostridia bacterium]|nr:glycosyltransferase [Clostridia bacterium]
GYDCAHIHGDLAYLLLIFAKAARRAGVKKIILHSHAAGIDGRLRRAKGALHALTRRALKRCATDFVACSDRAARWMYPNLDAGRVVQVNNGVDLDRFAFDPQTRERVRSDLGLEGAFVVGHVGRFAWQKNHEYLLRAFSAIRARVPGARLLMVGEGPLFDGTRALAGELGLLDDVIFYGASYDVGALMQAMDLFLLPSRFEGLPVVGVEAQAAGLPVIFSDAVTRQAKLTDSAWFLPTDEGAVELWARRALDVAGAQIDRRQGLQAVKRAGFAIEDTVGAFLALYGASGAQPEKGGGGA